jgi:hypothetical protein
MLDFAQGQVSLLEGPPPTRAVDKVHLAMLASRVLRALCMT